MSPTASSAAPAAGSIEAARPGARRATAATLALLVVAFLGVTLYTNLTYPLWEGGDEPQHFEQVRALARDGALPRPVSWETTPLPERNMSHQPPLYYGLQSIAIGWLMPRDDFRLWRANPFVTWPDHPYAYALAVHTAEEEPPYGPVALAGHAARFVSSLLGLVLVLATFLMAREALGTRMGLAVAGVVAFTPGVVYLSSTINNEVAAAAFSALALAVAAHLARRGGGALVFGLLAGVLTGLAGLAKLTGLYVLPVVLLAGLLAPRLAPPAGLKGNWSGRVVYLALTLALPVLIVGAWYWNVRADWDLIVQNSELTGAGGGTRFTWLFTPFNPAAWPTYAWALPHIFVSYWGVWGAVSGASFLPDGFYLALAVLGLAGLAGLVAFAVSPRGWRALEPGQRRTLFIVAVAALGLTYAVLARTGQARTAEGFDGRHLLSVTGALSLLALLGLSHLAPPRFRPAGVALLCAALLAASVGGTHSYLSTVTLPRAPIENTRSAPVLAARFANGLAFVDWTAADRDFHVGEGKTVQLRWYVEEPLAEDFEGALLAVARDGNAYVLHQMQPLRDLLPPTRWVPGDLVTDEHLIDTLGHVPFGDARLELHAVRASDGQPIPRREEGQKPVVDLGPIRLLPHTVSEAEITTKVGARYSDKIELAGYTLGEEAKAGEALTVKIFWRSLTNINEEYVVSLQLLDAADNLVAQADGPPLGGRFPTNHWREGDLIADGRTLQLPDNLAPGDYKLLAIVYGYPSLERLTLSDGADHAVLGQVTIRP